MRTMFYAVLLGWFGLNIVQTTARVRFVWQSNDTLWADAAAKAPQKPRPLINYGEMLEARGQLQDAYTLYQRAYATLAWRRDHRTAVSKYYAVQDMVHNLIQQGHPTDIWPLLAAAGCPQDVSTLPSAPAGTSVTWTCHVSSW